MINILISRNDIIMVIIVIVIIAILYFVFNSSTKEKFADINNIDLSKVNSMDDKTAINTLAQISKSLMSGGLTVPGDIKITGKTTIDSDTIIKGKTTIGGDTNITGITNINGAIIDTNGNLTVTSINIGGIGGKYTLLYDSTDKALKISNGVDTAATPVRLTLGDKCKMRADAGGDTSNLFIPNLSTGTLKTYGSIDAGGHTINAKLVNANSELIAGNVSIQHDGIYKIGGGKMINL